MSAARAILEIGGSIPRVVLVRDNSGNTARDIVSPRDSTELFPVLDRAMEEAKVSGVYVCVCEAPIPHSYFQIVCGNRRSV